MFDFASISMILSTSTIKWQNEHADKKNDKSREVIKVDQREVTQKCKKEGIYIEYGDIGS